MYARPTIAAIEGYTPGEQPKTKILVKLNTNENPYPPSPKVQQALRDFDPRRLRLYSNPSSEEVRKAAAETFGYEPDNYLIGNGSDDLLTIALRTFVDQNGLAAFTNPSYSLYPVLADIQGAQKRPIELDDNFDLPKNAAEQLKGASLFLVANPNAPTGNLLDRKTLEAIAQTFDGVLWIDEAYVDFAGQSCLDMVGKYPNVVVSRTLSKSYSLAGLRLGIACASKELIAEMNKVKDSYNVDMIAQTLATAAIRDQDYMLQNARRIVNTRAWTCQELTKLGFHVLPSATNFIFAKPPVDAQKLFHGLRDAGYLVRYFNLPRINDRIRISIGTEQDMEGFVNAVKKLI